MPDPKTQFVMSTELECMTTFGTPREGGDLSEAVERLIKIVQSRVPSLCASGSGIHTPYGRIYQDTGGHIELAAIETDSPYVLPGVVERLQTIVRDAIAQLKLEGRHLLLANNNHSGLLEPDCAIWGAHDNYITEVRAKDEKFTELILPFLVTRIYAGAGGVQFPSANFLAGVRPTRMTRATGGGTTSDRAIHSTAREEHHSGPSPRRWYRYHGLLGDGHRSHYNLALQFLATALSIKSIIYDQELPHRIKELSEFPPPGNAWVQMLQRLNVLAEPGKPLRVDPLVLKTQRVYLASAQRYADSLSSPPDWIPRALHDWGETLNAMEEMDRNWLARRLDAFAKYELFSAYLTEAGCTWTDLPHNEQRFWDLTLIDHSYHSFCEPDSVFHRLEESGAVDHRVAEQINPGEELEPFIPETQTRARPRAKFICENSGNSRYIVDWSWVHDTHHECMLSLFDPLAKDYTW